MRKGRMWRRMGNLAAAVLGMTMAVLFSGCCNNDCGDETIVAPEKTFIPSYVITAETDYREGSAGLIQMDSSRGFPVQKEIGFGSDPGGIEVAEIGGRKLAFLVERSEAKVFVLDPLSGLAVLDSFTVGPGGWTENPQDVVVVSEDKAYVSRYGHDDLLIVNPKTGAKTGSITFTGLPTNIDLLARPADMVLAGGKVFVALQNLDAHFNYGEAEVEDGIIAVINPATDTVIHPIRLPRANPQRLVLASSRNQLLVPCAGLYRDINGEPLKTRSGLVTVGVSSPYRTRVVVSGDDAAVDGNIFDVSAPAGNAAFLLVATGFNNADRALKVDLDRGVVDAGFRYPAFSTGDDDLSGLLLTPDSYLVIGDRVNQALVMEDLLLGVPAGWVELSLPPMCLGVLSP